MTLSDEVIMTDSGNDSESGSINNAFLAATTAMDASATNASGASSPASSSGIVPTLSATGRLAKLLAREQELIKTLEQLTLDIAALEKAPEDVAKEENADGEEEGDDLEEFEAPEWCVPIKANVMTYDWDVCLGDNSWIGAVRMLDFLSPREPRFDLLLTKTILFVDIESCL